MMPNINPAMMKKLMAQMNMKEIPATQVIIKGPKNYVINNPQVTRVNMMGQESYQISGEEEERPLSSEPEISEDDVATVAEQAQVSEDEAREALEETKGDAPKQIIAHPRRV